MMCAEWIRERCIRSRCERWRERLRSSFGEQCISSLEVVGGFGLSLLLHVFGDGTACAALRFGVRYIMAALQMISQAGQGRSAQTFLRERDVTTSEAQVLHESLGLSWHLQRNVGDHVIVLRALFSLTLSDSEDDLRQDFAKGRSM